MREIGFAQSYSFHYSKRPGTPAAAARRQIADSVKGERLQALQSLLLEQRNCFDVSCKGRFMDVLFEKPGRKEGQAIGRTPFFRRCIEDAAPLIGSVTACALTPHFPTVSRVVW